MKTIKKIIFWLLLAPIIAISMWIHESYKLWQFRQTLARCMKPSEKGRESAQDGNGDGNNTDPKSV